MAKKNYKKTPKTNTGDIIEGFGIGGGPRGMSRKTGYKIMNKFFKDNPDLKPNKNPANWEGKAHTPGTIKKDPTRNMREWPEHFKNSKFQKMKIGG